MIRKKLKERLEREAQKELRNSLNRITEKEITEELSVVRRLQKAKEAWALWAESKIVSEAARSHFEELSRRWKEDGNEPSKALKHEMIALYIAEDISTGNPLWGWQVIAIAQAHEMRHATWLSVFRALKPIKETSSALKKIPKIIARLSERLAEISNPDSREIKGKILMPLSEAFGVKALLPPLQLETLITKLSGEGWWLELNKAVYAARRRLERILRTIPDPHEIKCEDAMRRIVEIYESEPSKPKTSIQTLEDASVLEHVLECYGKCFPLRNCACTTLDFAVYRDWADHQRDYTAAPVEEAKKLLAANA